MLSFPDSLIGSVRFRLFEEGGRRSGGGAIEWTGMLVARSFGVRPSVLSSVSGLGSSAL